MISIHPFPARMAPELAIERLNDLPVGSAVLDPMSGSGTVVRHASELGLPTRAFDLDPLAVLISRVSSRKIDDEEISKGTSIVLEKIRSLKSAPDLHWIDGDAEAEKFVSYWFGDRQRDDLRRVAYVMSQANQLGVSDDVGDALRVALSRIIVTKRQAASLAQDTSHSRPHRVATTSNYDVLGGLERSISELRKRLKKLNPTVEGIVERGDARNLVSIPDGTIDYVLTSPPYLNAIDYMRGHRLSLIWLGHRYADLSNTRSTSIGAERAPDKIFTDELLDQVEAGMGDLSALPSRYRGMIKRYALDIHAMMSEIHRVLRSGCEATFVMGDSCLKGTYVSNSRGLAIAAELVGLHVVGRTTRALPSQHRYLPTPKGGALSKRMREEIILTFKK